MAAEPVLQEANLESILEKAGFLDFNHEIRVSQKIRLLQRHAASPMATGCSDFQYAC